MNDDTKPSHILNVVIPLFGPQFGISDSADFEAGTWTLKMQGDWRVAAGRFAITPVEQDAVIEPRQVEAQGLPYGIIDPDYARVFTMARTLAWSEGYAIAMQGSFTRDLDLLAVPWTDAACDPLHLVRRIEDAADLKITTPEPGKKPHGRLSWTLVFKGFSDPRFIDLTVRPRIDAAKQASPQAGDALYDVINEIVEYAHLNSTGPAVPDSLWEIRGMAIAALGLVPTIPQAEPAKAVLMTEAAMDVLAERQRQIDVEGRTAEHDDASGGDLAMAAGCYAINSAGAAQWDEINYQRVGPPSYGPEPEDTFWPWNIEFWKPKNPRRDLVRAAALLLAEIERIDRIKGRVIPADGGRDEH